MNPVATAAHDYADRLRRHLLFVEDPAEVARICALIVRLERLV